MAKRRGRGEGSIFQRQDGRWSAIVSQGWSNGKRHRKTIYGPTYEAVRVARDEFKAKGADSENDVTLNSFADRWLKAITPDLKPRTVLSYTQLLDCHVRPAFGAKKLHDIERGDLKRLLNEKRTSGLSKNTVRLIRATVSALFAEAIDEGIVTANPAAALSRRRGKRADSISLRERVKTIRPFSETELNDLLEAAKADSDTYPLFLLLARAGLRPGEAFALTWADLDFTHREILVERALSRGKIGSTKTDTVRRVDLSQGLADALRALLIHRDKQTLQSGWSEVPPWVFVNREGNPIDESRLRKRFARTMKAAHISGHRMYDLRHTFASHLLSKGAPITYVAAQLGHSKPTTTLQWYAHWLPRNDRAFVDALDYAPALNQSDEVHHDEHPSGIARA
jgi:integrase